MSIPTRDDRPVEAVSHLLSLGLTQLSIQVTLSTSLTASALGLAALATALTSTILTVQGGLAPHWQWALLPSVAATVTGLLATAAAGAEDIAKKRSMRRMTPPPALRAISALRFYMQFGVHPWQT
jgi:hypothetical protein